MYAIQDIGEYQRIVLQFPPEEVDEAAQLIHKYKELYPDRKFYVLSDHLHSSCCVDEVGAMHVNADLIIHHGYACFSETPLNIIYVLPKEEIHILDVQGELNVLADQKYHQSVLKHKWHEGAHLLDYNIKQEISMGLGYYTDKKCDRLLFIGSEESALFTRFIVQFNYGYFKEILIMDKGEITQWKSNTTAAVMKRCQQVEQAREINCFGLLINNPTAQYTKTVLQSCKTLLRNNNKKFYTFCMNNLNEAKLGNFPEVEAYVLISCYNNVIIDTKKFFKLLITPFQLQQVFSETEYNIKSDLSQFREQEIENLAPKQMSQELVIQQNQIVPMDKIFQTLDFYQNRTYQGLELKKDLPPAKLEKGLSGIASSYNRDQ